MAEPSLTPSEGHGVLEALAESRLMGIIRAPASEALDRVVDVLWGSGVSVVELALTSTDTLSVLERLGKRSTSDRIVGAGTVLTADQAERALCAGATYLVSPALVPEVIAVGQRHRVAVFPGAYTCTEVLTAVHQGAHVVKLFPAATGGPHYVAALLDPLPDVRLMPTGGVDIGSIPSYLAAGAFAVALGSSLVGDAIATGDMSGLAQRARSAVRAVAGH